MISVGVLTPPESSLRFYGVRREWRQRRSVIIIPIAIFWRRIIGTSIDPGALRDAVRVFCMVRRVPQFYKRAVDV